MSTKTVERYSCRAQNAPQIEEWIRTREGILIWNSVNLSNPSASWTTPAQNEDGTPTTKPNWQCDSFPAQRIRSVDDVDVITEREVRRFHVGVRIGSQGTMLKVTDAGTKKIRAAVDRAEEKFGKPAWYVFDYGDFKNAVILVEDNKVPMKEWAIKRKEKESC